MVELVGYSSDRQRDEFASGNLHPLLYHVFAEAARFASSLGWKMTVHSLYRTPEEDRAVKGSGIHCQWRAVDISTDALGIPPNTVKMVCDRINSFWQYDETRPSKLVAFNEPEAEFGPHLHLQVHDLTRKIK